MKAITFSLYTKQPLLATSFQGDPNSDVSYSYIPGSMIRGAMIGRYMKHHHLSEIDLESEEVQRLFFDSKKVKYLNAYLLSQKKQRTLPVVRSWFRDKDIELSEEIRMINAYDFSVERKQDEPETPKFVGEGFWTVESDRIRYYKEKRRINIHNRRDRTKGRSSQTTGEGEIFRYDAIDVGQTFQAVILCEEIDTNLLKELLQKSENLWLGGSQSAGYGHTKITDIKPDDNWNEVDSPDNRTEHEHFTITLLSDLILRDEWGQYAVIPSSPQQVSAPLTNILESALKRILELDDIQLQAKESFTSSTLIGGFNRKWGLPLPQVPAFAAGSVFVFEKIEITAKQIEQLEAEGLGERIIDGFGRIAVNLREDNSFEFALPETDKPKPSSQLRLENKLSRDIATRMVEKLLQEKLEQKLKQELSYLSIDGTISNSQLSRLQLIARQALPTRNCDLVLTLLNNLPANAKGQFERAKINHESFKQKLHTWLNNPESWTNNKQALIAKISDIESTVNYELDKEYTLRLIIAVAKKAMKERK